MTEQPAAPAGDSNVFEVLQSLIVAFVLAMAFRGFVLEGFVIPSGSMAPTLMGQHVRWTSEYTGYQYPIDAKHAADAYGDSKGRDQRLWPVADPMVGPDVRPWGVRLGDYLTRSRMGDRVLVMKSLYFYSWLSDFFAPHRWDVVVFKCPTDPVGDKQNFIKRLVGLPGESLLFADGDVFASNQAGATAADLRVQRKPDYIQRAVWQPVYNSDYVPLDPKGALKRMAVEQRRRTGDDDRQPADLTTEPPWSGEGWITRDSQGWLHEYRCDRSEPTVLRWSADARPIDDWNGYNMLLDYLRVDKTRYPLSDVRVAASVQASSRDAFHTTLRLEARSHRFEFALDGASARLRIVPAGGGAAVAEASVPFPYPSQPAFEVEFWHVDQRMAIYIDGDLIVELPYDWTAQERLRHAMGRTPENFSPAQAEASPTAISWDFEGSPVTLRRVRLDRDLFYRPASFTGGRMPAGFAPTSRSMAFGVDPLNPAVLGPDHFLMCGDNSPDSQDGRLWGASHALTETFIDPMPFVVHRKLLLGKAWSVYLPSPVPMGESGRTVIPDFSRLRFIR